ncbi:membrane protein insertion efficiency factor YidD [Flavobacterium sp. J27]|uniref:membrane protein insertion efficiency factor YidD n=1 Tax=Flavobacterium sp. J27 TaxID=2060419 RepID=UPI00102FD620
MLRILLSPFNRIAILFIKLYKITKRRKYDKCLHYPSCSTYGILALQKYNFFKAIKITYKRLKDCNPFSNRSYIDYP